MLRSVRYWFTRFSIFFNILSFIVCKPIFSTSNITSTTCYDIKENKEYEFGAVADSEKFCEIIMCSGFSFMGVKPMTLRLDCTQMFNMLSHDVCSVNLGLKYPHCCPECKRYRQKYKIVDKSTKEPGSFQLGKAIVNSNIIHNIPITVNQI